MRNDAKKLFRIISLSILFIFIIIYVIFRSQGLIFGVKIKNVNLINGKVTESTQKVTGKAKNAIELTLNDRGISIDQDGNFSETISLLPGYNTISIKAKDKFGNNDEKIYQLIY